MGQLIINEGMDFSGKSTFTEALAKKLNEAGYPTITTFEPGGTNFGREISKITKYPRRLFNEDLDELTKVVLFNAARIENVRKIILPALAEGKTVIVDRFWWSTLVYADPSIHDDVLKLHKHLQKDIKANFTFLHDIDFTTYLDRRGLRKKLDEIEESLYPRFDRMRNHFLDLAEKDSNAMTLSQGLSVDEKVNIAFQRLRRRLRDDHRRTLTRQTSDVRGELAQP